MGRALVPCRQASPASTHPNPNPNPQLEPNPTLIFCGASTDASWLLLASQRARDPVLHRRMRSCSRLRSQHRPASFCIINSSLIHPEMLKASCTGVIRVVPLTVTIATTTPWSALLIREPPGTFSLMLSPTAQDTPMPRSSQSRFKP